MRLMDRLYRYLEYKSFSAYAFEHRCGLSNVYLGKQFRGKGNIGSGVLEKIKSHFPDLNIHWLVTGQGTMTTNLYATEDLKTSRHLSENGNNYLSIQVALIHSLQQQIQQLEQNIADKDAIIYLLNKTQPHE
jgi:hypothetical protein